MRTLDPPPAAVAPAGALASGSYRGPLPRVDLAPLGRSLAHRVLRRKRWIYVAVSEGDLFAALAIVDLGYATKAFAFAAKAGVMLADRTSLGPPGVATVADAMTAEGALARFGFAGARASIVREGHRVRVRATFHGFELDWESDARAAAPALAAIGEVPGGGVNTTEKRALLPTTGVVRAAGVEHAVARGHGGWDYTHGYLSRRTRWRWAYFMGAAEDGTPIAMNLVEGFLGEKECGLWVGDALEPLGEGRFELDAKAPLDAPWRVTTTCGGADLRFTPWVMHAEEMNLGLIRAHFVQPIGVWEGTLRADGRALRVARLVGVAEDQDVLW